ncbi:hypothetical protein SO802_007654 [Lithocarpus litseifolius]|uniref:Bulb-type lectin domain-containing protein n=1 Tax=Lithocarpus litseifolius TaxID=425828 RepID=A0AAW2DUX5_9ROSI
MNPAKHLLITVLLLLLSAVFQICISIDTITPNQTLKDGQILVSIQKIFALGFFSPEISNHSYLGIWYNQITEQNVVWVANRDNPLNDTSGVLSINSQGNLVLHTQNRTILVWSTNVSVSVNSMAQLLDIGNLAPSVSVNMSVLCNIVPSVVDVLKTGSCIPITLIFLHFVPMLTIYVQLSSQFYEVSMNDMSFHP